MGEKIKPELGFVQKTLFLPLWGRAVESGKEIPLLTDKTAVEVLEKVDYNFSIIAANIHPLTQTAWIMRGLYTDQVVQEYLKKFPQGTIVNLGCGLDTSFERNDNSTVNWYEIDLPDVINLRRLFFTETDRRKFIACSVLEKDWIEQISSRENLLFIAAGLLYYFSEAEVKSLLKMLADNFLGSTLLCDISSTLGVKASNQLVIKNTGLDEKSFLKWGNDDEKEFTRWDNRFKVLKRLFYYRHKKLKLSFKMRLYGYLADKKRIQYMIHLKLN